MYSVAISLTIFRLNNTRKNKNYWDCQVAIVPMNITKILYHLLSLDHAVRRLSPL